MNKFSHVNDDGRANMVDISDKKPMLRTATACGIIKLQESSIQLIKENNIKKGDVLKIAEFAAINAAKQTANLIPLCHTLNISKVDAVAEVIENGIKMSCTVKCIGQTGVEMEALTATSIGLLTIYDMCKAVDKKMVIGEISLINKIKTEI